jgi:hypothetical protein
MTSFLHAASKQQLRRTKLPSFKIKKLHMSLEAVRVLPSTADQYPHGLVSLSDECTMEKTLPQLGSLSIEEFQPSRFVQPQSLQYELDGENRRW